MNRIIWKFYITKLDALCHISAINCTTAEATAVHLNISTLSLVTLPDLQKLPPIGHYRYLLQDIQEYPSKVVQ